jgi:hypothetical protein
MIPNNIIKSSFFFNQTGWDTGNPSRGLLRSQFPRDFDKK